MSARRIRTDKRPKVVDMIRARDGDGCFYCAVVGGPPMLFDRERAGHRLYATIEHVINIADGGTNDISNLVLAHAWCNTKRQGMRDAEKLASVGKHKPRQLRTHHPGPRPKSRKSLSR